MEPITKLTAKQMSALLKRHLDRAEEGSPTQMPEVSNPVIPGLPEQTSDFAPMMGMGAPAPSPPISAPAAMPPGIPPVAEKAPVQGEAASLIDQAEQLYQMVQSGNLGRYWESLFRTSPEARNYKDPELMFISMYLQRAKDPAGFAQSFPDEARLFDNLTGASAVPEGTTVPGIGEEPAPAMDPVEIYRKLGGLGGVRSGPSRTVQR